MTDRDGEFHELLVQLVRRYADIDRDQTRRSSEDAVTVVSNVSCGDRVEVYRSGGRYRISARGCAICRASSAIAAEVIRGKSDIEVETIVREVNRAIDDERFDASPLTPEQRDLYRAIVRFPARRRCATLAWEALLATVERSR
jgi:nitrogen fixation NifU-like protein